MKPLNLFGRVLSRHLWTQRCAFGTSRPLKHVLKISDLSTKELQGVLKFANGIKKNPGDYSKSLKSKTLLMLFEKPSLRTRVSFETGMTQMGGHGIFYSIADSPLGQKETFGDTGQVLSRYCDVVMARVKNRRDVGELAKNSTIPVINALDDWAHPCQMLADLMTIAEYKGGVDKLSQIRMCYLGDCHNNVTYDLMRSACVLGFHINVCGPTHAGKEHDVDDDVIKECKEICKLYHNTDDVSKWLTVTNKPEVALRDNIDVIYTDSWMSYGVDPKQKDQRIKTFLPYQVNTTKLKMAKPDCIFMNCLPAIRGMEQTADVIDGPQSVVFDQAENRLHAQKALLFYLVHGHMDKNLLCKDTHEHGNAMSKGSGKYTLQCNTESKNGKKEENKKRVLVALGGNALKSAKQKGTNEEMFENTRESCRQMVKLIDNHNYQLIITHGNGPQVGSLFFQQQVSQDVTPALPLNICGAMSQGQIGFMLQQCLYNELLKDGNKRNDQSLQEKIVTIVTQVVVDPKDPAWKQPSKPVGKFMSEDEALKLQKEKGYFVMEDAGRGWRVAVASPKPIDIVEKDSITQLCDDGYIVIASGGGGIPVVRNTTDPKTIEGRDAVIDKDLAAVLLGVSVRADVLIIATDIDGVYLNFNQKDKRKKIDKMTTAEAREYLKAGHFAKGSMAPKILAAIEFVEQTGKICIIGSLNEIEQGIRGEKGTAIVPSN